jgi:hypothetical protein
MRENRLSGSMQGRRETAQKNRQLRSVQTSCALARLLYLRLFNAKSIHMSRRWRFFEGLKIERGTRTGHEGRAFYPWLANTAAS